MKTLTFTYPMTTSKCSRSTLAGETFCACRTILPILYLLITMCHSSFGAVTVDFHPLRVSVATANVREPGSSQGGTVQSIVDQVGVSAVVVATNSSIDLAWSSASLDQTSQIIATTDSLQFTLRADSLAAHGEMPPLGSDCGVYAQAAFDGHFTFSTDKEIAYTFRPIHTLSLSNASVSFQLFAYPDPEITGTGVAVRVVGTASGLVFETNGNLALSGTLPPGQYSVGANIDSTLAAACPLSTSAARAKLADFEFRATTLPSLSQPPRLDITPTSAGVLLSWPAAAIYFGVEQATALGNSLADGTAWAPVPSTPALVGDRITVSVATTNQMRFFRLRGHL